LTEIDFFCLIIYYYISPLTTIQDVDYTSEKDSGSGGGFAATTSFTTGGMDYNIRTWGLYSLNLVRNEWYMQGVVPPCSRPGWVPAKRSSLGWRPHQRQGEVAGMVTGWYPWILGFSQTVGIIQYAI